MYEMSLYVVALLAQKLGGVVMERCAFIFKNGDRCSAESDYHGDLRFVEPHRFTREVAPERLGETKLHAALCDVIRSNGVVDVLEMIADIMREQDRDITAAAIDDAADVAAELDAANTPNS